MTSRAQDRLLKVALATAVVVTALWVGWARADVTKYVDGTPRGGGVDDASSGTCHGTAAATPWRTLQFAMKNLPQANTANGNVILRIHGDGAFKYNAGRAGLNPRLSAINGKRYFIYGDLGNPKAVLIDSLSGTTHYAALACSSNTTWGGLWFLNGLRVTSNPNADTTRYAGLVGTDFTARRMQDSVKVCNFGQTTSAWKWAYSNTPVALQIDASNVTVTGPGTVYGGQVTGGRFNATTNGVSRLRTTGVTVNGLTLYPTGAWATNVSAENFIFGKQSVMVDTCNGTQVAYSNPFTNFYVDSLDVWFNTWAGDLSSNTSVNKMVALYNCTHTRFRSNHWAFGNPSSRDQLDIFSVRDSIDGLTFDRDTLVCTNTHTRLQWFENVDTRSGSRVLCCSGVACKSNNAPTWGGRCAVSVDSSLFQCALQDMLDPIAGSFTYSTFVTTQGFTFGQGAESRVDTTALTNFDHCDFVATSKVAAGSLLPFNDVVSGHTPQTEIAWPTLGTNGGTLHFTNNLLVRRDTATTVPTCLTAKTYALLDWGNVGQGTYDGTTGWSPTLLRDVAKHIVTDNNGYFQGYYLTNPGDMSIAWRRSQVYAACGTGTQEYWYSRPGVSSFKARADSAACPGGPPCYAVAAATAYDSLSIYGHPRTLALWGGWTTDSLLDHVWYTGNKLDLEPKSTSPLVGAGTSGSDIGAIAYNVGRIAALTGGRDDETLAVSVGVARAARDAGDAWAALRPAALACCRRFALGGGQPRGRRSG
jgi:hypothetical protein